MDLEAVVKNQLAGFSPSAISPRSGPRPFQLTGAEALLQFVSPRRGCLRRRLCPSWKRAPA